MKPPTVVRLDLHRVPLLAADRAGQWPRPTATVDRAGRARRGDPHIIRLRIGIYR
jgi:hypothetical protein